MFLSFADVIRFFISVCLLSCAFLTVKKILFLLLKRREIRSFLLRSKYCYWGKM